MNELESLARLIKQRNLVSQEITGIIDRPSSIGHIGEYIASKIFQIELESSASTKAIDGYFTQGTLKGHSVNIKFYGKLESILDITPNELPEYYLVMTGLKSNAQSSRGEIRPWVIDFVFLFNASELVNQLRNRNVRVGVASSILKQQWNDAQIYPNQQSQILKLSKNQRQLISLFSSR
jgi:hypothetical protein